MYPAPDSYGTSLDVLGLSRRAYNCLRRAGIVTVERVAAMSDDELLQIRNLGVTTLPEIREKLMDYRGCHSESMSGQHHPASAIQIELPLNEQPHLFDKRPIEVLGLSVHAYNALMRAGITTIGSLTRMSLEQIQNVKNIGEKGLFRK